VLVLYQFEACEYSTQVRLKMSEWEIDYILETLPKINPNGHGYGTFLDNMTFRRWWTPGAT
jgi:hypothetical protein